MKIFLAGSRQKLIEPTIVKMGGNRLYSALHERTVLWKEPGYNTLMIDSAAHSWNKKTMLAVGVTASKKLPDAQEFGAGYLQLIRENTEKRCVFVEFDVYEVLGKKVIDKYCDTVKSLNGNFEYMRVYHPVIDSGSLRTMNEWIDEGHSYIGIGNDASNYYDDIFELATKKNIRIHGFAVTKIDLMRTYPFHSVDSSSWIQAAINGRVFCPVGDWRAVNLATKSAAQDAGHFLQLRNTDKENIRSYLLSLGYTVEELAEDYKKRFMVNAIYMINLQKTINENHRHNEVSYQRRLDL